MPGLKRRDLLAALPVVLLGARAVRAQTPLAFGTAAEGGSFMVYALGFLDSMRAVDPDLEIKSVPTNGTTENVPKLEAGELDIAMVSGEVAHELFEGIGRPPTKLKIVTAMYATPGMFAVRADSRFRSVMDLRGRPVAWGMKGSGVTVQARYVMEGLGLDMDRDFEPLYQEKWTDGPPLVLQGRAGALWGSGLRWPAFVELSNTPMGARFIVPNALEIQRICTKFAFLSRLSVPAGLYVGQYDRLDTVGTWSFILARPGLSDAVGFRIVSAIDRAQRTGALTKQLVQTTVKNTLSAISSPEALQGGVAEYYRKHGFLK